MNEKLGKTIQGELTAKNIHFGIVCSRFNSIMTEQLLAGALDAIVRHGGDTSNVTLVRVPGSFELPLTCKELAAAGSCHAVLALGAVIRGDTTHYDHVCGGATSGIMSAMLDTRVPIIFGVITVDTIEQAIERSGSKAGNKGFDAAVTAMEMVSVLKQVKG